MVWENLTPTRILNGNQDRGFADRRPWLSTAGVRMEQGREDQPDELLRNL